MFKTHRMPAGHATMSTNNVATSSLFVFRAQLLMSPSAGHGKGGCRDLLAGLVSFVNRNVHIPGDNLVPIATVDGEGELVTRGSDQWKIKITRPTLGENARLLPRQWVGMMWWPI